MRRHARHGQRRLLLGQPLGQLSTRPVGIRHDAEDRIQVGAHRIQELRAVGLRALKGGFMAQHLGRHGVVELQRRDEPEAAVRAPIPGKSVLVEIDRGLLVLNENPPGAPGVEIRFGPRVAVGGRAIVRMRDAEDQAHDVVRRALIEPRLILRGEDVVGRRDQAPEIAREAEVIPKRAKRLDGDHGRTRGRR